MLTEVGLAVAKLHSVTGVQSPQRSPCREVSLGDMGDGLAGRWGWRRSLH